jgi:ferritin-like metal-binding protein YciE
MAFPMEAAMNINDFREMYIAELQEACNMEDMLVGALPKMAEQAKHERLRQAFQSHLEETKGHKQKVEGILQRHGASKEHKDQSMQTLIGEAEKMSKMVGDGPLREAAMIASAQRIEHYEIALYGTLASYAEMLGLEDDKNALASILEEEKEADEKLSDLAFGVINPEAVEQTAA